MDKDILFTFGPFEVQKNKSTYAYTTLVDTRTGKRMASTYAKSKDAQKFAKAKIKSRLKLLDKKLDELFKNIEKIQLEQLLWEEAQATLDNPNPVDVNKLFGE